MWGERPAPAQIHPLPSHRRLSFSASLWQPANWNRGDRPPHSVTQRCGGGDAGSAWPGQHLSQGPVSLCQRALSVPGRRAGGGHPRSGPTCWAEGRWALFGQTDRRAAPLPRSGAFTWSQVRRPGLALPAAPGPVLTCQGSEGWAVVGPRLMCPVFVPVPTVVLAGAGAGCCGDGPRRRTVLS